MMRSYDNQSIRARWLRRRRRKVPHSRHVACRSAHSWKEAEGSNHEIAADRR